MLVSSEPLKELVTAFDDNENIVKPGYGQLQSLCPVLQN